MPQNLITLKGLPKLRFGTSISLSKYLTQFFFFFLYIYTPDNHICSTHRVDFGIDRILYSTKAFTREILCLFEKGNLQRKQAYILAVNQYRKPK